jgi:hypothetical protein
VASRPRWRRAQLAINIANLAASLALIAGAIWAWLGEHGWPASSAVLHAYGPVLAACHCYWSEPAGTKALGALIAGLSLVVLVAGFMFSFKVNLEEIAVMVLGIPFYLLLACCLFLLAALVASLVRLL